MRLTLRTLLAYLDDVLDPADAQDIGKKIEESEFAANIVHRTRDVMRRLRLGAPRLSGRGMGLDPNTVAEYLDNTLAAERVGDFEKVCLESDVHLAEVASCHQVLAIVLGEAADVAPAVRERMYKLLDGPAAPATNEHPVAENKPAAAANTAAATPAARQRNDVHHPAATAAELAKPRRKVEVPEYLRQPPSERSWRKPVVVVALVAMLAVVLVMAIDGSWLAERLGQGVARNQAAPTSPAKSNEESKSDEIPPAAETPAATEAAMATGNTAEAPAPTTNAAAAAAPAAAAASELQQPESVGRVTPPAPPPLAEPPVPAAPRETPPTAAAADAKPAAKPAEPAPVASVPAAKPAEPAGKPAEPASKPAEPAAAARPATANGSVGRLISTGEVLLRNDAKTSTWQRVPAQEMISAGQKLLALPAFRPTISLTNGITLELLGGSLVSFEAVDADGVPGLVLEYGRVVALTPGRPDERLNVMVAGRRMRLTFGDAGSTVALEASPKLPRGVDPEAGPPAMLVALYVPSGMLEMTDSSGSPPRELQSPIVIGLGSEPVTTNDMPEWIGMDRPTQSEKIGAEFLAENLTTDRPALLGLKELAEHRRVEVRTLAVQSLAHAGDFDPLVAALNQADPNFKTIWINLINDLRAAISRGPDTAARVREAFERQRGENAPALYRMLWGYSPSDLKANDGKVLKELVANLDHNDMDYRSLAFWNLWQLTGATLFYQPHTSAEVRRPHILKWRQRLESGQILPPAGTEK